MYMYKNTLCLFLLVWWDLCCFVESENGGFMSCHGPSKSLLRPILFVCCFFCVQRWPPRTSNVVFWHLKKHSFWSIEHVWSSRHVVSHDWTRQYWPQLIIVIQNMVFCWANQWCPMISGRWTCGFWHPSWQWTCISYIYIYMQKKNNGYFPAWLNWLI